MSSGRALIPLFLICMFFLPVKAFAQADTEPSFMPLSGVPKDKDVVRRERVDQEEAKEVKEVSEGQEGKSPAQTDTEECKKGSQACAVDRKVKQIEDIVGEQRKSQAERSIWDLPDMDEKPKGPKKVAMYIISVPTTYVARFVTWPVAIFADYLIKKGVVNKVINVVSNKERTFWIYPRLELGFGNGFGGGIGVRHFDLMNQNYQFYANYIVYLNVDQRGAFGLSKPDMFYIGNKPFGFKFETKLMHDKDTPFYGIGPDTPNNRANYAIDAIMTGGAATFSPFKDFLIEGGFYVLADITKPGESPSVETLFPSSQLPGFGDQLTYGGFGLTVLHDTRDASGRPEKGGLRRGTFARFQGLGSGQYDFNFYMIELIQYIKLWLPRHVLGLRTAWQYRQPTGRGEIPFPFMSKIDVYSPVRGFSSGRFRDRGSMVFNVQYRFPVWEYLDGEFFFDAGRVFHTMSDISFKQMELAGGGGLLFTTKDYFLARIELGYGGEGVKFLFKTSQAF